MVNIDSTSHGPMLFDWLEDIPAFTEKSTHRGCITRVFKSSENWSAGILWDVDAKCEIRFIAHFRIELEEDVVFNGYWQDNTYKGNTTRQFVAEYKECDLALNEEGLYKFLKNNSKLKGIGEKIAKKIATKYWNDFDNIIMNNPMDIVNSLNVSKAVIQNLQNVWKDNRLSNQLTVELSKLPLTQSIISKIIKTYNIDAMSVIKNNPYALIKTISGYGFKTADNLAMFLEFPPDSDYRIMAAINYILTVEIQCGFDECHCWIEINDLVKRLMKLLDIPESIILNYIYHKLENNEEVTLFEHNGILKVSDAMTFYYESYSINFINKIKDNQSILNPDKYLDIYKENLSMLNSGQLEAIKNCLTYDFSIITGKAGTGKTFVITNLIHIFNQLGYETCLLAPTGKAAKRIEEVTNHYASTIHKLLRYNTLEYEFNEKNKLTDYDIYIVDEFSMVDNDLAYRLLSALPDNVKVILVGDHNQLPPIGPGLLFKKLLEDKRVDYHITELTEIVRQAGNLKVNSTKILEGHLVKEKSNDWELKISNSYENPYVTLDLITNSGFITDCYSITGFNFEDIQIITPIKKGPIGVYNLNIEIQRVLQLEKYGVKVEPVKNIEYPKFYLHDRVIQIKNDYQINVMNGTIGYVVDLNKRNGSMKIKYDDIYVEYEKNDERLSNVNLAYALTIHKTQGSEFPCVVVLLNKMNTFMLYKNLLYTAVTRASKKTIIISDNKAIYRCLTKDKDTNKNINYDYIIESILNKN